MGIVQGVNACGGTKHFLKPNQFGQILKSQLFAISVAWEVEPLAESDGEDEEDEDDDDDEDCDTNEDGGSTSDGSERLSDDGMSDATSSDEEDALIGGGVGESGEVGELVDAAVGGCDEVSAAEALQR